MNKKNEILIKIEDLNFSYNKNSSFYLNNINLEFYKGNLYAILGENGSGKSTLLKCINNYINDYSGKITININNNFVDIKKLKHTEIAKQMSFVTQQNKQNSLSVYDYIMLGRKPYINFSPLVTDYEIVSKTINEFALNKKHLCLTRDLSGGEFQKVCIARAFAQKTPIILMDEPTNNLDIYNQHELFKILKYSTKAKRLTTICIIHDINLALKYADVLIFIKNGKIIKQGLQNIIDKDLIKNIYGIYGKIIEDNNNKYIYF